MNAIILGCGYVGKAMAQHWKADGITVTATTTTPERLPELEAQVDQAVLWQGDDLEKLRSLLQHQDTVLLSVGAPRGDAEAYEATYLKTAQTLVQALENTTTVQQVIYTGSYAVYGDQQGNWVDESTPVNPANRNGEILVETEQILLSAATPQRSVCVFRLGGICGPGREIVNIFRRAAGSVRPGDGQDASNWIHLDDIVGAIAFARTHQLNGIYNLVHDVPLKTGELLDRVFTQYNLPPATWDASQPNRRPYNAKVSNQKLRQAGYTFHYTEIPI
ncbi:MAG: SDR family oxidoreductase [Thainema sp.]